MERIWDAEGTAEERHFSAALRFPQDRGSGAEVIAVETTRPPALKGANLPAPNAVLKGPLVHGIVGSVVRRDEIASVS